MNNKITNEQDTFLIHDYETFGKHPSRDRPSQFSGIRTDCNFNPIGKPETFFCSLPNDYLPDPEAVLLTNISPIHSLNFGLKEYQFAEKIQKIFHIPKTCILGYNNIQFDNEFSRNIFYRNFFDPYSWSWKKENSNWDLLHIMRASFILRPEGIKWPIYKNGNPSFRLQDLSMINNITHSHAHNALSDVYATLKLAKLIKNKQPKLFNYLYHYRKKKELKKLINLHMMKPVLHIPTHSFHKHCTTWIIPLVWHPNNPNLLIACDLNNNLDILKTINIKSLNNHDMYLIFNKNKYYNKILTLIHINKCPILTPIKALRPQDVSRLNINPQYFLNNFKKLKTSILINKIIEKMINVTITSYDNHNKILNEKYKTLHVDNQLYTGFFNSKDRNTINIIRHTHPELLKRLESNFFDERLQPLLFYYRARNFPNTLNYKENNNWIKYKQSLFTEEKIRNYTEQLNYLFKMYKQNKKKQELLYSLIKYLEYINTTLKNNIYKINTLKSYNKI